MRSFDRSSTQFRPISFQTGFIGHHPGSVLVSCGKTRVLCTATIENRVPPHRVNSGGGWLTAEYGMLPASTPDRKQRAGNKQDGRATEIQRLIGRSLRQAVNIDNIGQRSIAIDCDVIEADGGTRTASITGAWVALALCVRHLESKKLLPKPLENVLTNQVAAISLGIVDGKVLTDLDYLEDVRAHTDFNLVACADGRVVELQGTAERDPMNVSDVQQIMTQGLAAIAEICELQRAALK